MSFFRHFVAAALLLLLAACAAPGPVFEAVPAPARGYAIVYVYRPDHVPVSEAPANFYIDNVRFASLWTNNYTVLHLPARPLTLRQDWPMVKDASQTIRVPLDLQAGSTYYLRLDFKKVPAPIERGPKLDTVWALQHVPQDDALQELKSARLEPAGNVQRIVKRAWLVVPPAH